MESGMIRGLSLGWQIFGFKCQLEKRTCSFYEVEYVLLLAGECSGLKGKIWFANRLIVCQKKLDWNYLSLDNEVGTCHLQKRQVLYCIGYCCHCVQSPPIFWFSLIKSRFNIVPYLHQKLPSQMPCFQTKVLGLENQPDHLPKEYFPKLWFCCI